jgi:hypothetical protein
LSSKNKIIIISIFILVVSILLFYQCQKNTHTIRLNDFSKTQNLHLYANTKAEVVQTTYEVSGFIDGKVRVSDVDGKSYEITRKIDSTIFRDNYHNNMNMTVEPLQVSKGNLKITVYFGEILF